MAGQVRLVRSAAGGMLHRLGTVGLSSVARPPGLSPDPRLCGPASRRVCLCRVTQRMTLPTYRVFTGDFIGPFERGGRCEGPMPVPVPDAPGRRGGVRGVPEGPASQDPGPDGDAEAVWRMWDGFGSADVRWHAVRCPWAPSPGPPGPESRPPWAILHLPLVLVRTWDQPRPRSSAGSVPWSAMAGAARCAKRSEEDHCRTPVGRWSSPFAGSR